MLRRSAYKIILSGSNLGNSTFLYFLYANWVAQAEEKVEFLVLIHSASVKESKIDTYSWNHFTYLF